MPRRNARGGRSAAEHLVAALRCLYKHAEDDGLIDPGDNPARKVDKPRRLPSTRRAVADNRLAEINQAAATTGDDPELDTLLLRLHTETACRRGGALALRPQDLDPEQCLILLREKGETVRWQPVSPTLMAALLGHAGERHAPPDGQLLRYRNGRRITYRRYDHLWERLGRYLPWVRAQQISMHWIRHTTLTWVERNFGYAVARAYAGHTDSGSDTGATATYVRASHPRGGRRPGRADRGTPPARHAGRVVTGMAALTAGMNRPGAIGPGPAWSGPGPDHRTSRDGTGPRRSSGRPDRPVLAAAGPGRPGRGRGVVRLGRHRAEDRVRAGLPAAGYLAVAAPGHRHHPARRRNRRRTPAYALRAWLADELGQRPDPPVRQVVRRSAPSRSAWPGRSPIT